MSTLESIINDPERRATAAAQQAKLRAELGHRLAQNPAQAQFLWGQAREQQTLDQLSALTAEDAPEMGEAALRGRTIELYRQLAEGYAAQGRYADAVAASEAGQDGERRAEYEARRDAVESISQARCEHPAEVVEPSPTDAKGFKRKVRTEIERVYDGGRVIAFLRCSECRAVSAEIVT